MRQEGDDLSGMVVSALRGGSGKTVISIGIIAAFKKPGKKVAPFKKGPDYIDAGWLALAAGRPCYNLDTFLIKENEVLHSFQKHSFKTDLAVIEGNRGLYDGIDLTGSTSTAELAKLLQIPVVLCIDCTKSTRTMAAAVYGCLRFDKDVKIISVILNRVAGKRHEKILRDSIEHHCGIPVMGALPKLKWQSFPQRHMGLVPTPEHGWALYSIEKAAEIARRYIDLDGLLKAAGQPDYKKRIDLKIQRVGPKSATVHIKPPPKIGIVKDSAFQFYYPENIEALKQAGADIVFLSPLKDRSLPAVDALYIGGGFPETHAEELAANKVFKKDLKSRVLAGLPVYAECGGLIYLGQELFFKDKMFEMAGVLPVTFGFSKKPQGHGYTQVKVIKENPFFEMGSIIRGHEFHYSKVIKWAGNDNDLAFAMQRGTGFINHKDGVCLKNVFATYTHMHALGTPLWAKSLVLNAARFKKQKRQSS